MRVLGGFEGERLSAGAGVGIGYGDIIPPPPSPRPRPLPCLHGDLEVVGPVEGEEEAGGLVRRRPPAHTELLAVHVQEEGLLRAPLRLHRSHLGGGSAGNGWGGAWVDLGEPFCQAPRMLPPPPEGEGGFRGHESGGFKDLYSITPSRYL